MWPFGKNNSRRRPEHRRSAEPGQEGLWRRFRDGGGIASVLLAAAVFAAALAMDAWPLEPLPYRRGQYVLADVYARVPFEDESPAQTARQREAAGKLAPAVIVPDASALQRLIGDIKNLPGRLKAATQPAQVDEATRKAFNLTTPEQLAAFARYADPDNAGEYNARADRLAEALQGRYVVTGRDFSLAYHAKDTQDVRLRTDAQTLLKAKSLLLSLDNSRDLTRYLESAAEAMDLSVRRNVLHHLQEAFAAGLPLYHVDEEASRAAERTAQAEVRMVMETIPAGKLLVPGTERGGLTESQLALLAKEHAAYVRRRDAEQPWLRWLLLVGRAGMVLATVALTCLYVRRYRPRLAREHGQALAAAALLVLVLLLDKVAIGTGGLNPYLMVFGVFVASSILAIAYDQRFAFAISGALVVLTGLQQRLAFTEVLVLWGVVAAAVFQLREVRTRSKLIECGGVVAVAAFVMVWAVQSVRGTPFRFTLVDGCYAAGSAIVAGFIAQGILPLAERVFAVATSLTLLEWCDANKPLLKRLALEAPGTYNHSLVLGTMCEAAAEAIGARGLLARVGAYYHDVGKINKPDYFIENRPGPGSRHDRLNPTMSLLIIKGHVKDGLQLARRYGLPRVLYEFIATHHGTTLVEYFYHEAARRKANGHQRGPEEVEFRHLGPKPSSKEAAILLLADAAESSVRAMDGPTPGRIEGHVHAMIQKRLADGQLDDCELTLKEVHGIEVSLVKSLCGIYHGRIPYPSQVRPDAGGGLAPVPAGQSGPAVPGA